MKNCDGLYDPAFDLYIGIDYSGAKTPTLSLKGLRVYRANSALRRCLDPALPREERIVASIEGWILGVGTRP